jgi:hypothetical protein
MRRPNRCHFGNSLDKPLSQILKLSFRNSQLFEDFVIEPAADFGIAIPELSWLDHQDASIERGFPSNAR